MEGWWSGGGGGETDDENGETHKSAFECIRKMNWYLLSFIKRALREIKSRISRTFRKLDIESLLEEISANEAEYI